VHSCACLQVGDYWGWFGKRSYHHTGPVSTFYAMREAMALVAEEGLDNMWWVPIEHCPTQVCGEQAGTLRSAVGRARGPPRKAQQPEPSRPTGMCVM